MAVGLEVFGYAAGVGFGGVFALQDWGEGGHVEGELREGENGAVEVSSDGAGGWWWIALGGIDKALLSTRGYGLHKVKGRASCSDGVLLKLIY